MMQMRKTAVPRQVTTSIPRPLLIWLSCGTLGSLLFTTTYLIEGVTRPGYSAWQQSISALSLGPGGWLQQVNFVVFGVIIVSTAFAWRRFLKGGVSATWYPIFRTLEGLGLIMDGFFSTDPGPGYPPGTVLAASTLSGEIHNIFAYVAIGSIALGFFVLARRFVGVPHWRGWVAYSVLTGLLTIVFIATFGAASGQHSAIAGIFERLATSFGTLWGLIFFVRLWMGTELAQARH